MLYNIQWVRTPTKITILLLLILAKVTATNKIDAAVFPTVYMPERFDHVQLNGFSRAMILSQRGLRYSSNLDCTMTLSVRGPFGIHLSFEHIDLARDTYDADSPCEDYVQFYGGAGKETMLSGQHCGSVLPLGGLATNVSSVTVRFRTNQFRERSGFRLKYLRVPIDMLSNCDEKGVCSLIEEDQDEISGERQGQGSRMKRSVGVAKNSGMPTMSHRNVLWTSQQLVAISLGIWTSVLLAKIQNCCLQNR